MRRILWAAIVLYAITAAAVAVYAVTSPEPELAEMAPADVIVVLGAGMDPDGTLHRSSTLRVDRGVELWKAGLAPRLHFTGGAVRPGGPSAGERTAARAIAQGVPAEVISHEGRSQSTLQNALFSQPMLAETQSLRLVTEGFHLPRAWASFKWAGGHRLYLSHSERLRQQSATTRWPEVAMVLREALAVWFNLARVVVYGVAGWAGVNDDRREGWLA